MLEDVFKISGGLNRDYTGKVHLRGLTNF